MPGERPEKGTWLSECKEAGYKQVLHHMTITSGSVHRKCIVVEKYDMCAADLQQNTTLNWQNACISDAMMLCKKAVSPAPVHMTRARQ